MSHLEEQEQELEILESIYPDELEKLSANRFNIHVTLETTPKRYLTLEVEFPETYPEVVPDLRLEESDGSFLGADEDDENLEGDEELVEFTRADLQELLRQLREVAEENIGMQSIFTIASTLKENAEELDANKIKEKEAVRLKEIQAQEDKENAKFKGTTVTPESFAAWREKFREEFQLDADKSDKTKLTGREIFERGLNVDADEEDEALVADTEKLAV